ncbi:MAG: MMPL family transporter [Planctomycetaceae bacterium]
MDQLVKRIRLLAIYVALLLPLIAFGAFQSLQSSNNSPIDWVNASFSERKHYDEFVELFGPGDVVIASWPKCFWSDSRLDRLVRGLREAKAFRTSDGDPLFQQVTCGRETLLRMVKTNELQTIETTSSETQTFADASHSSGNDDAEHRGRMSLQDAIQRLQGTLIGPDGRTTCIVVTLNRTGMDHRGTVIDNLRRAIRLSCGVADEQIHLAGPVMDGLTTDRASHRSLTNFAGPSAFIIFLICWWSLRSLLSGAIVFLAACFCQSVLLAAIYYTGQKLSALLIILPPLVQVLTISGGIHLMNYYRSALLLLPPQLAAIEAFRRGWLPTVLSLGTTAMGTASLMVSGLEPIRLFGVYGTIGVLLTTATVLTVIPCSMILWRGNRIGNTEEQSIGADPVKTTLPCADAPMNQDSMAPGWHRLATLLARHNFLVLGILLGMMAIGALGLSQLRTSVRIETLFAADSRIMQDYRWLEENLGPLVPIEVLITFPPECTLSDRGRLDVVWRINSTLQQQPHVRSITSALTFFPPLPPMKSLPASMQSAMLNKAIDQAKPGFEQAATVRHDAEGEVWRLTAHVSALESLDYGSILTDVRNVIDIELQKTNIDKPFHVTATTTGIMPLVHKIQDQLLSDLFNSLISALIIITITMTIVEAGLVNGLVAMVSNTFPIVVAFGGMGWLDCPMDIGSVMTASVALGIAVDDTLHFLTYFRRSIVLPGATRRSAVIDGYHHCGRAMIQTSVSCGLGLLVFAFSDFVPTSRFAILITLLLMLALLGDLILLPALLLSRAGKLFDPRPSV